MIRLLGLGMFALVAAPLAVFGAWIAAVCVMVAGVLAVSRFRATVRGLGALGGLLVAGAVALAEYPPRIAALRATVDAGGAQALSTRDCAGIWLLNVGMAAGGTLAGFPEAGIETLLLAVPRPDVLTVRSSFPMGSARMEELVDAYIAYAEERPTRRVVLPRRRVVFGNASHAEWRRALALNPLVVDGFAERVDGGWTLDLVGRVEVDYPPQSRLILIDRWPLSIVIDEGLYDALEQRGWLFPYTLVWRFQTTRSDDNPSVTESESP